MDTKKPDLGDTRKVMLDKERILRMDFNALAKAEEVTKKNFNKAETWRELSATDYRALTWACLLDEQSDLTIEQVGKLLLPRNEKAISEALLDLYISNSEPIDDAKTAEASFTNAGGEGGQSAG